MRYKIFLHSDMIKFFVMTAFKIKKIVKMGLNDCKLTVNLTVN